MRYNEFVTELVNARANPDGSISRGANANDEQNAEGLQAGPPYPAEKVQAVKNVQRKLEDLGYSVGSTGIDGKYGPRTSRAVSAFKRDNRLQDADQGKSLSADDIEKLSASRRIENPSPTGNERTGSTRQFSPEDLEALDFGGGKNEQSKTVADEFLGREMNAQEWEYLIRATVAEASPNAQEQAAVAAVILNRSRSGQYPDDIRTVLTQRNQFQAVTGTRYDPSPSRNFTRPTKQQVASVVQALIDHLPNANRSWLNFTSNDPNAYGRGTNVDFRRQVASSSGSRVIGGTVFGTV